MSAASASDSRWRTATFIGGALFLSAAAVLVAQHLRHGWPFSLHHGVGPASVVPYAARRDDGGATNAALRAAVQLDPSQASSIGLTLATVRRVSLGEPFRVAATIAPDERRVSHVHTRVAGWIQRVYVNVTGQRVRAGQTLATIFSQELLASQNELLGVLRAQRGATTPTLASAQQALVEGARNRLRVLGMTDAEVAAVERAGVARREVAVVAPRDGVVLRRGVTVGAAVDPSTEIVTVADLSHIWALLEVPESQIPNVAVGSRVTLVIPAAGENAHEASVEFLAPTLTEQTRTLRARATLPNPDGALRPGTFGTAMVHGAPRQALVVPRDAVVDTGRSQHVFVATAPETFEPRPVVVGARTGEVIEVRSGLSEGQRVVASGVFLLDSESRLRASGGESTGHTGHGAGTPAPVAPRPTPTRIERIQSGPPPSPPPPAVDHGARGHAGHGG